MSLKTRLRKLEQIAPKPSWAKDPNDMTDEELDAAMQRVDEQLRRLPGGAEYLAQFEITATDQGEDEALQAKIASWARPAQYDPHPAAWEVQLISRQGNEALTCSDSSESRRKGTLTR